MTISGALLMGKEHLANIAADGSFILTLLAHDPISIATSTAWRLTWCGPLAADFYHTHQQDLKPGALLSIEGERVWGFGSGRPRGTELHAMLTHMSITQPAVNLAHAMDLFPVSSTTPTEISP